jgi:signal transduction histidine kinase
MDKLLRRTLGDHIRLEISLQRQGLTPVHADPSQIEQIIMNLCINARDAMPNGGKLSVTTSTVTLDENFARHHAGVAPGKYALLAVSDTGTGISAEVRAHLFEPFFTTKPKGKGTGLGLATCDAIVKQCGGHIGVASEPGKGTTFNVYFPTVGELPAPPTPP